MIPTLAATTIADISRRSFAKASMETPLEQVVAEMTEQNRGAVVIVDHNDLVLGVFTERDLIMRVDHSDHSWHSIAVGDVMTQPATTILETAALPEVIGLMQRGPLRRVPVVDAKGRAVGMMSIRDILVHIAEQYPQEFINLPPDPEHEATRRWGG